MCAVSVYAQKEVIETAAKLVDEKKYDEADAYLDGLLKKDKNNVDALMMTANVILNREYEVNPGVTNNGDPDDDITGKPLNILELEYNVLSKPVADTMVAIYRKCLRIDSARFDIRKLLCLVYARALMKEELKKELEVMIRQVGNDNEQAYNLADFAREIMHHGDFEGAMDVYGFIAARYPNLAGIRCDIGSEYFFNGKPSMALQWFDSAMSKPDIDETTYLNAAFAYSELGYFDMAQKLLDDYSVKFDRTMGLFYKGLRLFADMNNSYADTLRRFMAISDSNAYYSEFFLARELTTPDAPKGSYMSLLDDTDMREYYVVLLHQRALKQFPNKCGVYLDYGKFNTQIKNYAAAVQFLDEEQCPKDSVQVEERILYYGFVLYKMGEAGKAVNVFQPLLNSRNSFNSEAANYFTAKILLSQNKKEEAKVYLKAIASYGPWKYGALARRLLERME